MKSVLIPVDFSEISFTAARYAAGLVSQLNSKTIILYHSFAEGLQDTGYINSESQEEENALTRLRFMQEKLQKIVPDTVRFELFCNSKSVKKGILTIMKEMDVSFIVMGASGLNNLDRDEHALGLNTREIMSIFEVPLLVVPRYAQFQPIGNVVFSTDLKGIEKSFPIINIKKIIEQLKAKLQVIYVELPQYPIGPEQREKATEAIQTLLGGIAYTFHIVEEDDNISQGILGYVYEHNLDLIVLASRDYSFFKRLFHNSVSQEVLRTAKVPVFLART